MDWLEEIKARAEAVPEGPWKHVYHSEYFGEGYGEVTYFVEIKGALYKIGRSWKQEESERFHALAEFITHSRTDIPRLIAEVERLRGLLNGEM